MIEHQRQTAGRFGERAGRVVPGGTGLGKLMASAGGNPPSVTSSTQSLQSAEREGISTRAPEVGNNSAILRIRYGVVDQKPRRALLGEAVQPRFRHFRGPARRPLRNRAG